MLQLHPLPQNYWTATNSSTSPFSKRLDTPYRQHHHKTEALVTTSSNPASILRPPIYHSPTTSNIYICQDNRSLLHTVQTMTKSLDQVLRDVDNTWSRRCTWKQWRVVNVLSKVGNNAGTRFAGQRGADKA
jgi:hypothetical protein